MNYSFAGYSLFHQPKSLSTNFTGSKGTLVTVPISTAQTYYNAYQFTTGSKVLLWNDSTHWNTGIITSIDSTSSIKVTLDNIPSGAGYNLTSLAYNIIQLDKFRPYSLTEPDTNVNDNYQLITGLFNLDGSKNLIPFSYDKGKCVHNEVVETGGRAVAANTYYEIYDFVPPTATRNQFKVYGDRTDGNYVQLKTIYSSGVQGIVMFHNYFMWDVRGVDSFKRYPDSQLL
jgi:hypothetical protein